MDFWIRLKTEIKNKNTTQEWIAGKIGVPLSTFRKWMTRKTYPNLKEGIDIAKLLDTTSEFLVTGNAPEGLSDAEYKLVKSFRKLNKDDQENISWLISAWVKRFSFNE
jgi:transcriptional regulator with XRE-family HTH domain